MPLGSWETLKQFQPQLRAWKNRCTITRRSQVWKIFQFFAIIAMK